MSETRSRPPTSKVASLEQELKLDPIEQIQVREKTKRNPDTMKKIKLKLPYDYEAHALSTTGDCNNTGPRVWIMTSTPEPLRTIFTAIRTSYSPFDQAFIAYKEYFEYLNRPSGNFPNDLIRLLSEVVKMRHLPTLEHVSFTFGIRCISREILNQLNHCHVEWNYSTQNYHAEHGFEYIVPPGINEEIFIEAMSESQRFYNKLISLGVKPEDANYVIPNAATVNVTVTCNLRKFVDFYESCKNSIQWETKMLAERMRDELLEIEPGLEFLFEGGEEIE